MIDVVEKRMKDELYNDVSMLFRNVYDNISTNITSLTENLYSRITNNNYKSIITIPKEEE